MPQVEVDWELVDERLPLAQVPAAKAVRDQLFKDMDGIRNGFLSMSEAYNGLPALLEARGHRELGVAAKYLVPITDFRPAVKCAFSLASKVAPPTSRSKKQKDLHKSSVDRREFHALLFAFRTYVELEVLFGTMDSDKSRSLNWKECEKFLPQLAEWGITKQQAKTKFPDDWTAAVDYRDFADWCIMKKFGGMQLKLDENDMEETLKDEAGAGAAAAMLKAFASWDKDENGKISADELADVLLALDSTFTREEAMKLFGAADMNQDGFIDYKEFTEWVTR